MKKYIVMFMLAMGLVASSNAVLVVQWQGLEGFVQIDGTTPLLDGGGTSIATLIFSASGDSWGVPLTTGNLTQGDEIILQTVDLLDEWATVFQANAPQQPFQAGFIYARVFGSGTEEAVGQPLFGTYYYESPLVAAVDISDITAPQFLDINTGSAGIPDFGTDVVNRQVVPEPSTLAFLGLGGLALALRRRFVA